LAASLASQVRKFESTRSRIEIIGRGVGAKQKGAHPVPEPADFNFNKREGLAQFLFRSRGRTR
jgi:hypothetical protein